MKKGKEGRGEKMKKSRQGKGREFQKEEGKGGSEWRKRGEKYRLFGGKGRKQRVEDEKYVKRGKKGQN